MSGPDFVSADWLSEEPLSVREHSSDHRFAVSMRDLAAANGLFLSEGQERRACCELVWRGAPEDWGYAVFAGLKDVSSFVQNLYFTPEDIRILSGMRLFSDGFLEYLARYRFRGSMSSVPEGTVVFPGEPVLTLSGGLIDVQLFESALCCLTGRASYIATKASRLAGAAGGRAGFVSDGSDALTAGAASSYREAAYIGGVSFPGGSFRGRDRERETERAGLTMPRSWVPAHENELQAFRRFAEIYPQNCCLPVDTEDVLKSGIPNAIRVDREVLRPMGRRLAWVRMGADNISWISRRARSMLDEAGMANCGIMVTGLRDEKAVENAVRQGACADAFDMGSLLAGPCAGLDMECDLVEVQGRKLCVPSVFRNASALNLPDSGSRRLYRIFDGQGVAAADLIAEEGILPGVPDEFECVDPSRPWQTETFHSCSVTPLFELFAGDGRICRIGRSPESVRAAVRHQLCYGLRPDETRLSDPVVHKILLSREICRRSLKDLEGSCA